MPRFAILYHETPPDSNRPPHFDFLLESETALRTWALAGQPAAGQVIEAQALPDHRLHYLDYEGPVSDNRGTVTRWDSGSFEWLNDTPQQIRVRLAGGRLAGIAVLGRSTETSEQWHFSFSS